MATLDNGVWRAWKDGDYMAALSAAWTFGDDCTLASWEYEGMRLGDVVARGCQQAVERAEQGHLAEVRRWLDSLGPPPVAVIHHDDDPRPPDDDDQTTRFPCDDDDYRARMIEAWLRCTRVLLDRQNEHWTSCSPTATEIDADLPRLATSEISLGFLRDLVRLLLRSAERPGVGEPVRLNVLLVKRPEGHGVVASLILEAMSGGSRTLYPAPGLAFLPDSQFRGAAEVASSVVRNAGLWPEGWDARWRVVPSRQGTLPTLRDASLGAAFGLGLAKLFASV